MLNRVYRPIHIWCRRISRMKLSRAGIVAVRSNQRLQAYKHVIKAIRRPSDLKLQFFCTFYYDFVIFAECRYHVILRRTYDERVCTSTRFEVRRLSAVNYTFFCAESDGYTFLVLVQGRKFQGSKVPPMVLSLLGAKVRGNESSIIRPIGPHYWADRLSTGPRQTGYAYMHMSIK